jgi:hypothetical protein
MSNKLKIIKLLIEKNAEIEKKDNVNAYFYNYFYNYFYYYFFRDLISLLFKLLFDFNFFL